jgi:hypothetical protein
MFLGPARKAPEKDIMASGEIQPFKNNFEEVVYFDNRWSGFIYLTVTRVPIGETAELTDFKLQITHL